MTQILKKSGFVYIKKNVFTAAHLGRPGKRVWWAHVARERHTADVSGFSASGVSFNDVTVSGVSCL